ncbi:Protein cramped [Lucilia cuprina]|uniref:Protein cramped n=1 Tax=Lucilia cuprina TaxID=7375 RepID=A0A0L0C149_LUCCU|nr:Protein cramped [Lucilia cuprina]KNC25986.1 Protein cramped [Lucilia cuprina]
MDKGQLPADKLMNSETNADDGCNNRDDVAVAAKKEKLNVVTNVSETIPTQTNANTHPSKTTSRGKESLERKQDVIKTVPEADTEELLGSVTTYNCHGTRTSARVIQKMRQDQQTRPITPPPSEREGGRKDERTAAQKTPSQVRANRPTWSNIERNHFFDALNEFGKDFEAIGNFINTKLKRRSPATDVSFKSKDQVRQHYYQTYHKICKYIRFSEEVRKPVQELYALINYGEMRRKLQFVTDKHFMKLRNLIYHGHISVRCKGKNIRIKTPSCKALRRLNQLDDTLEDIRLPSKIEVIISPANMEAFGRVQTIAQNPRCRTTVPLHKKLVNFIKTFEHKWRSMDVRIAEEAKLMVTQEACTGQQQTTTATHLNDLNVQDSEMCFLPKPGVTIHRPLLSITEYLSSVNICLTAYEERMGVKVKGEHLNAERTNLQSATSHNNISSSSNKRLRTESGSEKRSPEQLKRMKPMDNSYENLIATVEEAQLSSNENDSFNIAKNESSGDELSDEIHELLSDSNELNTSKEFLVNTENLNPPPPLPQPPQPAVTSTTAIVSEITSANCISQLTTAARSRRTLASKPSRTVFKPLLNDDVIQRIRSGWTSSNAGDITIGDLYVVFGHDSKLQLDYYWMPPNPSAKNESQPNELTANITKQHLLTNSKQINNNNCSKDCDEGNLQNSLQTSALSNKLKQLLLIANLSERMRRRSCTCDRSNAAKVKFERDLTGRTFIANKSYANCGVNSTSVGESNSGSNVFRQPMIPVRRTSIDPVKQLTTLTRQKMSRQVLVQRLLLPSNGSANATTQLSSNLTATTNTPIPVTSSIVSSSAAATTVTAAIKSKEVPWNQADRYKPQTTTATTITTTTTSNQNPQQPEACNTTFLNSLTLNNYEEMPQTSTSLYQPPYKDLLESSEDRIDGSPTSGIPSVDSAFDESSNNSFLNGLTPMHLLRETSSNSKWLEDNINDFSLTSLLGHLDEINSSRDMLDPSSNLSVISESSVDYMHKFQEFKALFQSDEKD